MPILKIKNKKTGLWEEIPAIKGDKGDAFKYEDFTPEQLSKLKGEPGKSGVHVGTTQPQDGSNVWIDPSSTLPTEGVATKEYVNTTVSSLLDTREATDEDILNLFS